MAVCGGCRLSSGAVCRLVFTLHCASRRQVLDKVPHISHINVNTLRSTLFLQVTVDDLGICLPINSMVIC